MNDQSLKQNDKPVKPCIKCGAIDRYADGECRPCAKAAAKKRYNENKEKELERNRAWREKNPEYARNWRLKNLDKHQEQCRNWHRVNADKSKANNAAWKRENKDKIRQRERQWRIENPELARRRDQNRRMSRNANGGKLSKNIVERLMALQNGKCVCCGVKLNGSYELDHIMPIALGGSNSDDNVQLLRVSCNRKKGAKHPLDWAREQGRLL